MRSLIAPFTALLLMTTPFAAVQAENRIDTIRPDAPALAPYGQHAVGRRTIELVNPNQIDVAKIDPKAEKPDPLPMTDRKLTVDVFYPAADGATGSNVIEAAIRDGSMVELVGRSMQDAEPDAAAGPFPLLIVSHGYPGNRHLMMPLVENLASKGYVVASIDHQDSTYRDQAAFGSTLVHRPLDQRFVLAELERLAGEDGFLNGLLDASNAGLIGYSMGGYGAVINGGGGVTSKAVAIPFGAPHGLLGAHEAGSDTQLQPDPRIKTMVAIAPWGRTYEVWDAETLKNFSVPTLFIAGSQDDVSGYEGGIRAIFEETTGADRALLTFEGANHNAAAPMPAPAEAIEAAAKNPDGLAPYDHYSDAVWDNVRMNNITQHFVTAWMDSKLKGDAEAASYLELVPKAEDGTVALEDGKETAEHTYWKGFAPRTAKALRYESLSAGE